MSWVKIRVIDAGSSAAALRVASYARSKDEFAHVVVHGQSLLVPGLHVGCDVRHVLARVDEDQRVIGFGNDIGVRHLTACNAKRMAGAFGHRFVRDGGPAP